MQKVDYMKIAGLPIDESGRLLIVKWKNKPIWFSLGGVLETGESEIECLIRETKEELNAEVSGKVQHLITTPVEPAAGTKNKTVIIKFYTMQLSGSLEVDNEEIEDYKWISKKQYQRLLDNTSLEIGSGLVKYAIPKLISRGLLK